MKQAFRTLLTGSAAVAALCPASRIAWGELPQGSGWPRAVLNVISENRGMTMQGPDGMSVSRVQVDCYALSFAGADGLAQTIIDVLHGHRDTEFRLIAHDATRTGREGGTDEAEMPFRHSLDFLVSWRPTNGAD
jgi:hypothetical protein